jgi:phage terminase large subunit-like protein
MRKAIQVTVERTVTLNPIWYDEQWHHELVAEGRTDEQALNEMLLMAWSEDWTSVTEELFDNANAFVEAVKKVEVVDAPED